MYSKRNSNVLEQQREIRNRSPHINYLPRHIVRKSKIYFHCRLQFGLISGEFRDKEISLFKIFVYSIEILQENRKIPSAIRELLKIKYRALKAELKVTRDDNLIQLYAIEKLYQIIFTKSEREREFDQNICRAALSLIIFKAIRYLFKCFKRHYIILRLFMNDTCFGNKKVKSN